MRHPVFASDDFSTAVSYCKAWNRPQYQLAESAPTFSVVRLGPLPSCDPSLRVGQAPIRAFCFCARRCWADAGGEPAVGELVGPSSFDGEVGRDVGLPSVSVDEQASWLASLICASRR